MRIKIAIYLGVFLFVASCNNSKQNNPSSSETTKKQKRTSCANDTSIKEFPAYDSYDMSGYPLLIDSLGLQPQYTKAKWLLYCLYCYKQVRFQLGYPIQDTTKTLGELNLKFESATKRNDTAIIFFSFFYNDTVRFNASNGIFPYYTNVELTLSNDSVLGLTQGGGTLVWNPYLFSHPLQPEIIRYIVKNKDKIDPWFYQEAKKRGVFDITLQ